MAFSFVLLLYGKNLQQNKLKRQMQLMILGIAILLTLSKGLQGLMFFDTSFYAFHINRFKNEIIDQIR